jgi:hypothetical protein
MSVAASVVPLSVWVPHPLRPTNHSLSPDSLRTQRVGFVGIAAIALIAAIGKPGIYLYKQCVKDNPRQRRFELGHTALQNTR